MRLNYERRGRGEPLVLIHGSSGQLRIWDPVLDRLAAERDVIALDLPGHGGSPLAPRGTPLTAAGFAPLVAAFLRRELGVERPHVAGNSMGGWTALEMAKRGDARSATAIAPAGMWRDRAPRYSILTFKIGYGIARLLGERGVRLAVSSRPGRALMTGQYCGRPSRLPVDAAVRAVRGVGTSPGFPPHLEAIIHERFTGGREIDVPVTVAWCERDAILLRWQGWRMDELPPHTQRLVLHGCGHVPMTDDPELVARVLLGGSGGMAVGERGSDGKALDR